MADGVDPAVDAVQAAGTHASAHAGSCETGRQQLRNVDHSVLAGGDSGNEGIRTPEFGSHTDTKPGVGMGAL
jgi:hypothetical protein